MSRVSHLGYITLGVIANEPGSTAYAVMKNFQKSPSSYFSGSAGAIYPLVKRLEENGLIAAKSSKAGSRSRKHYSVTPDGKTALRNWLSAPIPEEDVAFTVDLLRTRVLFFKNLTKTQQRKFVIDVRKNVQERIKTREELMKKHKDDDKFELLASRSAVIAEQARLKWLDELEKAID